MREIKFRAWDSERQTMENKSALAFSKYGVVLYDYEQLMQYTGLKDKNEVEIYNKDIIKDGSRLWIVEISSLYGVVLRLLKDKKITRPYVKFEKHLIIDFEVIGNLYENPELLKDTK